MSEREIEMRLGLHGPLDADALATRAEAVLEAVETYAKSCVDGPAVGYTLEPLEIHLLFTTEADDEQELESTLARVQEIIEGETPLRFAKSSVIA
ncbi:MAG: hypothetical protein Q8O56_04035 [Solirubrobacteraceae bacterium]|nr:hypothetical protein [Solirubrobacteraceae bacterium]